jgi:hypothetical protein
MIELLPAEYVIRQEHVEVGFQLVEFRPPFMLPFATLAFSIMQK